RITKPEGWDVLNADDPRVLAMRRLAAGRPWLFSLDADHPAIRTTLAEGGRAISVLDGALMVMTSRRHAHRLLPVEEVPVTLAGISNHNLRNAMAAAAAALGAGLPEEAVVEGLRTFVLDPERNPGRANLFEVDGRVVVIDYAHNEDGMRGLIEICQGLGAPVGPPRIRELVQRAAAKFRARRGVPGVPRGCARCRRACRRRAARRRPMPRGRARHRLRVPRR